jgi:hypothetical protein
MFSQDIIFLKNGNEIQSKVSEILTDLIKYKKWENQEGPMYSVIKSDVFMIKYQNGSKDVFNTEQENNTTAKNDYTNKIIEDAKMYMDNRISLESEGACYLIDFKKQNGVERNYFGQIIYTLEYSLTIKVLRDFWKESSDKFMGANWYWSNFKTLQNKGDVYAETFTNNYKFIERGTFIKLTGEIEFEKTDNGMRQKGSYKNKTSEVLPNYTIPETKETPKNSVLMNKPNILRDSFVGEIIDGKRQGKGKMIYKSGEIHEGNWVDDKKEGFCTIFLADGSINYTGEFKNDKPNGKGILYDHNRVAFDGNWVNGKKDGYGKFCVSTDEYSSELIGNFVEDNLSGEGEANHMLKKDKTIIQWKGTFKIGSLDGKGSEHIILADGFTSSFDGEFKDGSKWNGTYFCTDNAGRKFFKEYKNGIESKLKKIKN